MVVDSPTEVAVVVLVVSAACVDEVGVELVVSGACVDEVGVVLVTVPPDVACDGALDAQLDNTTATMLTNAAIGRCRLLVVVTRRV